jgi:hypothetical protein
MAAPPQVISEAIGKTRYFKDWEKDQLLSYWTDELSDTSSYKYRDALVRQMLRKGADPTTWMTERDEAYGLYPDIDDPDFAARLYKKAEFASLASTAVAEDTCSKSRQTFETTAVQRLVARFLHPSTPYNGLLLNHGVGVGKTCSAITVAETFLEVMPHNRVYILAPPAISEGFKKTIFDISKLRRVDDATFALTGERWESPQCTGMTYLRLAGVAASEDLEEIEREVNKLIRRRYKIMGYGAFANMIMAEMAKINPDLDDAVRDDFINADLIARFSDHLIIVDEAHNLRDVEAGEIADDVDPTASGDAAEGKKLTPILQRILAVCEGLRLMLMTATPMYDTAPEILFLLNLLILNDGKDAGKLLRREDIFDRDGRLHDGAEKTLAKYFRRYISYMRGENPNTFPLRLTPAKSAGADFMAAYPERSIKRSEGAVVMTEMDIEIMSNLPLIAHYADPSESKVGETLVHYLSEHAKAREERTGAVGISDMILDQTMQIANIIYPDETFGGEGWNNYFKDPSKEAKRKKRRGERGAGEEGPSGPASFEYIGDEPIESIFTGAGLVSHAPKIAAIVESITKARGISFVFSRYVRAGALPLAIALELAGWCRVLADGTPAPLLIRPGAPKPKYYYVLLTSDKDISPNFKGLLSYATTFKTGAEAATGSKVKAIIGSQVASEGLDLKCIRELHIMDPWYHLNRIEQIEGRGVRFCSHAALPLEERNCLIYLHAVTVPDFETADLYAYRLAVRKAQPIGMVSRLMKINAWDCMLNRAAILLEDLGTRKIRDGQGKVTEEYELADKPFTSFCDFMDTCEYLCSGRRLKRSDVGSNKSTYREADYRRLFAEKQTILAKLFSEDGVVAEPLEKILNSTFEDLPRSMAIIGLRGMLGNMRIKHKTGIYGTLILQNGYIVFQPDKVTDTEIPLALRYGRAYSRLPRSMSPLRGTILQTAAPIILEGEEEKGAGAAAAAPSMAAVAAVEDDATLRTRALASLRSWMAIVERIMSEPDEHIEAPEGFKKERFYGLRWLYHHFGELEETPLIAARWWMDNVWTFAERNAMLADWVTRYDTLSGDEKTMAGLFSPSELYNGKIRGYLIFDPKELKLANYCFYKKSAADKKKSLGVCPSTFENDVVTLLAPQVNRETDDTDEVFGFQATIKGITVFKTVHKPTAEGRLTGAECDNDSNVLHHHPRVQSAMKGLSTYAPADPIHEFLLNADPAVKPSKKEKDALQKALKLKYEGKDSDFEDFTHLHDLSLLQVCPYLEYLLRYMDLKRIGDKRWFLSLVDSVRALPGGKKGIKMT